MSQTHLHNSPWQRVSKGRPCPVCGKPDWCLYAGSAPDPTAAICGRIESPKRCGEAGWLHRLRDDPAWEPRRRTVWLETATSPTADFGDFAARCAARMNPLALARLAGDLGLSVPSLNRLGIGWSTVHSAWTFPMRTVDDRVTGVRLRLPDGRKLSVRGGKEGLFIPSDLDARELLLIGEGLTDTAALLDLDFAAVGRPSCRGGVRLLVEFVRRRKPAQVVVVADGDGVGRQGADRLASVLVAYAAHVCLICPPDAYKDVRQWTLRGATYDDVAAVIEAAESRRLTITSQGR